MESKTYNENNAFNTEYLRCKKIWIANGLSWQKRYDNTFNLHRFVKEKLPAFSHVLDIGCSDGIFAYNLAQNRFGVLGLDASSEAIKVAKEQRTNMSWSEHNPKFTCNKFEDFTTDRVFHYVTMLEFCEHLPSLDFASLLLHKAYDLAAKGVIVSVPIENLVPDKDHKIIFSATNFFKLIHSATTNTTEPPPLIEYYLIHKACENRHNQTFTPNLFVAFIKKQWVSEEYE